MLRSSRILIACVTGFAFVAIGACGGDTVESDGNGGSGGQVLDSSTPDVTTEGGPDTGADVGSDASVDAPLDQSAEAETSVVDAEVLEGSLFDLTMPDVEINDAGATLQGCYDCAASSCSTEMAECEADNGCRTILLCLFEDQCFGGPNGIDTTCGFGCVQKAGITSPTDPAVSIALEAGQCISGSCQEECGLNADGGLPFDASVPDGF
jgi:hypothetical protein